MRGSILAVVCGVMVLSLADANGNDWLTWRHDARRSGVCAEQLASSLHLQWTLKLPPTVPAWPNEPRLHFDAAYEPVVAGKLLLVGSPNDGSVTAYEVESGQPRWQFFAEGPIRFAPAVVGEKLFAASDDGYLYCLNLADGTLRSRIRGAPEDRPERRHLGNARLVSFWPCRGGPVVADGTVYFAAGIWPTLGVFVVAVDVERETVHWRNGELAYLDKVRLDHNHLGTSGLSPEGYLAVADDLLLVPNGRSMPAALDRHTGQLRWYVQGYRNGDCRVAVSPPYAFVGDQGVVDLRTGREVGSRWLAAGKDAPHAFDASKIHLFEGPIHPYKTAAGCSARAALDASVAFGWENGRLSARDLSAATIAEFEYRFMDRVVPAWRWDAPLRWELPLEPAVPKSPSASVLRAGGRVYVHAGGRLSAVDPPTAADAAAKLAWQVDLPGRPTGLLAAAGRLFVVTGEGTIACFGAEQVASPAVLQARATPLTASGELLATSHRETVELARQKDGYCLVLGLQAEPLVEQLLLQTRMKLIGIDADRGRVNRLRQRLVEAGLYATRAELFVGDPATFDLPPYLADLVVSSEPWRPSAELLRRCVAVLRPYGGEMRVDLPEPQLQALWPADGRPPELVVRGNGTGVWLTRTGPLPHSAPWTHECADAGRSYYSQDLLVKPPLGVLWYGDGPDYGFWKEKDYGTGVKPQVIGGRLFALQISSQTLFAYDVYTGRLLWKAKTPPFTRYASLADGIYVAGDAAVMVLDPATGQQRSSWPFEIAPGVRSCVADLRVGERAVVVAAAPEKVRVIEQGLWDSTTLIALDRRTGQPLWKRQASERFNLHAVALGAGMVFCIDSPAPAKLDQLNRQGQAPPELSSTLLAIDEVSGENRWTETLTYPFKAISSAPGSWLSMRGNDDWLAYSAALDLVLAGKTQAARAVRARDGQDVWSGPVGPQPLVLRGTTFMSQAGNIYDTATGKLVASDLRLSRGGCNYCVANEYLLLMRDRSASYIDLQMRFKQELYAVRSGCSNSLIAADGVLSVPNFAVGCVCNYPIQACFALLHMPETAAWNKTPGAASEAGRQTGP